MSQFVAVLTAAAAGVEGLSLGSLGGLGSVGFGAAATLTLPATIAVVAGGLTIAILATHFARRPQSENQTMRDIQAHHARQNRLAILEDREKDLEEMRRCVAEAADNRFMKQLEEDAQRRELERTRAVEQEEMDRQKEREDEVRRERQRSLAAEEARIAEREQELQQQIEEARQRLEEEKETAAAGVQPIQWPTEVEFRAAQKKVQYSESNFHFAIVGKAGCGKSSLINAFLNLKPTDPRAAPTGITETTLEICRYPDPGKQAPRSWTVWYDVPGAGTQRIPRLQYFTNQALFVFDIIILAIGDRFEETDCQIIRSCIEFGIPFFIVRSKADQHISNMMRDEDESYQGPFDSGDFFQSCRQTFIDMSEDMVRGELERAGLPVQKVYCVSKRALRDTYNGSLQKSVGPDAVSHEMALVKEFMLAAYQRRCGSDDTTLVPGANMQERTMRWARAAYTTAAGIAQSTIGMSSTRNSHQQRQPNRERNPLAKRVLYLPRATTVDELQSELDEHNPGLSAMLAARPRMMGPKVALLSFAPTASIPQNIVAFGKNQVPTMYKEKASRTGRTSTVGSSVSTSVNTPSSSIYTPEGSIDTVAGGDTVASGSISGTGRRQRRRRG